MTIPQRLERVWSKWPESRPATCGYKMLWQQIGSTGVWHWGNDKGAQPAPGSIVLLDKAAEALAFDAMVEAVARPGSWVRLRDEGSEWSCRTGSTTDPTFGHTRLDALLSAVEKMLGLEGR